MRYLGIDMGARNIGVATGEIIASELTTLRSPKGKNFYEGQARVEAISEIAKLVKTEEVDAIVFGLPINEDGGETEESKKIRDFAQELEGKLNIDVHLTNETLTTFMAEDILESQGYGPVEISERKDQLAATLILQQYIEENASV